MIRSLSSTADRPSEAGFGRSGPLRVGPRGTALLLAALLLPGAAACGPAEGEDEGARSPATAQAAPAPAASGADVPAATPRPGEALVIFGADTVVAEVARTADERAQGLMGRNAIPDGTGMLFVFERAEVRSFWMKNTFVPLDIAFLDASFRVIDIQQMEPESEEYTHSSGPALLALEVREGWFAEHGIGEGAVAEIVFGG